jgi:hypothetical protein
MNRRLALVLLLRRSGPRDGKPFSIPAPSPQPHLKTYATSALNLFTDRGTPGIGWGYTRQSYFEAFGVYAPDFDSSRPVQSWFDSTAHPDQPYSYNVLGRSHAGLAILEKKTMPGAHARTVNLSGENDYPPYVIEDTNAYQDLGTWGHSPINPVYLSTEEEATALMEEWRTELDLECRDLKEQNDPKFPYVYPSEEKRRVWFFTCDGAGDTGIIYPGIALADKNAEGVGHPGEWDLSQMASQGPMWEPEPEGPSEPSDPNNVIVMPLRDLMDNERLTAGTVVMVERTDLG